MANDSEIEVTDAEVERQTEDLNADAFKGLIDQVKALIDMHKFEPVSVKLRAVTTVDELKDWIIAREMKETELLFDLLQYVYNLRDAP